MHIISHKKIKDFYERNPEAQIAMEQWYYTIENAEWKCFADIKNDFNSVDSVGNQHYVFNISGNKYRCVTVIKFTIQRVYIRFVGTHKEYDMINSTTI